MGKQNKTAASDLQAGISIILPTYKGEKWIVKCLDSLANQTLSKGLFEIIVIINGEKDNTETLIDEFQKNYTDLEIIKLVLKKSGASNARNKGINKASRKYTTFIDDDDWISDNYLEFLYNNASDDTISIGELIDVDKKGIENPNNHINLQIKESRKKEKIDILDISHSFSISATKLIPTKYITMLKYDKSLSNGEDVVYFSELVVQHTLNFKIAKGAKYFRLLRKNSISRQNISFDFNILDRLAVIERLNKLFSLTSDTEKIKYLKYTIVGQVSFIEQYLERYPKDRNTVKRTIGKKLFYYFPYSLIGIHTLVQFELEHLNQSLADCKNNFREVSSHKSELLEKVQQIPELRSELKTTQNELKTTQNELKTTQNELRDYKTKYKKAYESFKDCKESLSYRLGHTLIHEKKSLISPAKIIQKAKTFKKILKNKKKPNIDNPLSSTQEEVINTTKQIVPTSYKKLEQIKVALLCDEFSYNSFKDEFKAITFEPSNWKEVFETTKPDLFFCESAWAGIDSKKRPWKGKVYSSINFKKENRVEIIEILAYCKIHNIPTIFWNKEDPTHYIDKVHNFVNTATKFDYTFTTAEECVDMYKNEYHCKNVYCLPFATQPRLFNPIEKYERSDAIVFAGSWYAQHKERCVDMKKMFDAILKSNKELIIYDRHFGTEDTNHHFPKKYQQYVRPSIPHDQIDKAYKSSIFGLNINTVKNSPTMFARRVFELMSSNTFVLSNDSLGTKSFFDDKIVYLDEDPKTLQELTPVQIEHIRDESLHLVLEKHTYYNRFKEILDKIDFPYIDINNTITIVMLANSENDIENIQHIYKGQSGINKKLLIILTREIDDIDTALYYEKYNNEETGIIALSYLHKYHKNWESIITTPYFSILDRNTDLSKHRLKNAVLHTSYMDEPIVLDSSKKYTYSDVTIVKNIISKKSDFKKLLENYNKSINGKFYHV